MEKITVNLPTELRHVIKELARRSGRSQSAIIRDAIVAYVARQEPLHPKTIGLVSSGRVQATEVEDWLAEHWTRD